MSAVSRIAATAGRTASAAPLDNMHTICIIGKWIEFEFDPTKAKANLRRHGVDFSHAEQALRDPGGVTIEDPAAKGEQRFATLGMDALGRILVVIHTPRGDRVRIISARKASRGEMEDYHA